MEMNQEEVIAYLRSVADRIERKELSFEWCRLEVRHQTVDATTVSDFPNKVELPTGHIDYAFTMKFHTAVVPAT